MNKSIRRTKRIRFLGVPFTLLVAVMALAMAAPATAVEGTIDDENGLPVWAAVEVWYRCYHPPVTESQCFAHSWHASDAFIYGELRGSILNPLDCETPNLSGADIFECSNDSGTREYVCGAAWGNTRHKVSGDNLAHPWVLNDFCYQ